MDRDQLVADLVRDEDLRLKPYPCPAGKLTIGVGRNLDDVGITRPEALFLLDNDIARCEAELKGATAWWKSLKNPARQRAILNMYFNLGFSRFMGFQHMRVAIEEADWERAAAEALDSKWAQQVGARADRIAALIRDGE